MAFSNPISTAEFWDAIPLQQGSQFEPDEAMEVNRTGGGSMLTSSSGHRLWRGSVTFGLSSELERRKAAAVLNYVRQPGLPFLVYDRKREFPAADPDGTILGASSVTVLSGPSGDLSYLRLQGLPAGYELTAGDLIGYTYGTDPVRYYVHELAESITADSAGETEAIRITPFRAHEVVSGTAVTLIRPPMVAVYDPGSFAPGRGRSAGWEEGRAFRFIQTMEY